VLLLRLLLAWLLFAIALILLFLTSWTVVPGFNRPLLVLAVGVPELAPVLAPLGLSVCLLAALIGPYAVLSRVTMMLAVAATALVTVPLVQVPSTLRRFDAAFTQALGRHSSSDSNSSSISISDSDPLRDLSAEQRARMRPAPVVLLDAWRGLPADDVPITRDVLVSTAGGVRLTVDIYHARPSNVSGRAAPCVVQIYGGAWQRGAPENDAWIARYLAARGFAVFAIDYRHAPQWQWPAQIEDIRTALRWVRDHAVDYGADATRLALFGRSSGAHLAMIAAYEPEAPPIDAVVSFYGPVALAEGYRDPPVPDPLDVRSVEEAFLGGPPARMPDRYRAASPITYVTRQLPPTLLIYGRRDHIVLSRFGRLLDERLRGTGTTSIFLEIPWAEHAFDALPRGLSGQISLYYAERFLTWALLRPQPR